MSALLNQSMNVIGAAAHRMFDPKSFASFSALNATAPTVTTTHYLRG